MIEKDELTASLEADLQFLLFFQAIHRSQPLDSNPKANPELISEK